MMLELAVLCAVFAQPEFYLSESRQRSTCEILPEVLENAERNEEIRLQKQVEESARRATVEANYAEISAQRKKEILEKAQKEKEKADAIKKQVEQQAKLAKEAEERKRAEEAKKIPGVTTADKIERPESAKLKDAFKKFGKYAKQIAKPVVRVAAPFVPFVGPIGVGMGVSDTAKAAEQGFTSPDELALAYLAGPEAAKGLDALKEKVRGQIDETEEFVP